jgi:hypothetical protein
LRDYGGQGVEGGGKTLNIEHRTSNVDFQNKPGVLIVEGRWVRITP